MDKLLQLISRLPKNEYVRFQMEDGVDSEYLCMCHFVESPEDGWKTEGDRFGSPPDSPKHEIPCRESWKYEDRAIFGITGHVDSPKAEADFINLCYEGLKKRVAK